MAETATEFIRRLLGAWDCCGTCAGGVLARRDAERDAAARAEDAARLAEVERLAERWQEVGVTAPTASEVGDMKGCGWCGHGAGHTTDEHDAYVAAPAEASEVEGSDG